MDASLVSPLLKQLLEARSPEIGARLKQRLTALLVVHGYEPLDVRKLGYRTFRDFLERTQGELVKIDHRPDNTDIQVSLRATEAGPSASTNNIGVDSDRIRSDIWQAFASPNPQRKRFLDKQTFAVKHFLENVTSDASVEVSANLQNFIEIHPSPGSDQIAWMKEYLDSIPIQGAERPPLDAMLTQQYSANLNSTFTRALGEKGDGWRHFRTQKISQVIEHWAASNNVPLERLRKTTATPLTLADKPIAKENARARAQMLLQLLSDEDISTVVVPILVSTILVRSRI